MTEEKNIDASKQPDKSQGQFGNERLNEKELENVAGGTGLFFKKVFKKDSDAEYDSPTGGK